MLQVGYITSWKEKCAGTLFLIGCFGMQEAFFLENAGELCFIILRRYFRGKEPQYKA
jgi:hypothetical protein